MFDAAVIGYGRFGALWASILAAHFPRVAAADAHEIKADAKAAAKAAAKDGVHPRITLCDVREAASRSRAVFLCVPISALRDALASIAPHVAPGALVADTCSVKEQPVSWMLELLPADQPILATHPLFGPDSFSISGATSKSADGGAARDAQHQNNHAKIVHPRRHNTIITYPARMDAASYETWLAAFRAMGLYPQTMEPAEHDRQAAQTQALTHLLGRVLGEMGLAPQVVSTQGYEALLEIIAQTCSDSSKLFLDMHRYNRHAPEMRKSLAEVFEKISRSLDEPSEPSSKN